MKNRFAHHIPRSDSELKTLWDSALVVPDTNTLLNLYRWSDDTSALFSQILNKVSKRLWIPDQVAFEYFENREKVIEEARKSYDDASREVSSLRDKFEAKRGHPHLAQATHDKLIELTETLTKELSAGKATQTALVSNDPNRDAILELFEGKVGPPLEDSALEEAFKTGSERYKEKIPPGYKDEAKAAGGKKSDKRSAYGDYLLWKQLMEHASVAKTDVIFVTDDAKEDWFKIISGNKTVGPRPELLEEFNRTTGQQIAIYRPEAFMQHSEKLLNVKISQEAIEEVREASRSQREQVSASEVAEDQIRNRLVHLYAKDIKASNLKPSDFIFKNEISSSPRIMDYLSRMSETEIRELALKSPDMDRFLNTAREHLSRYPHQGDDTEVDGKDDD